MKAIHKLGLMARMMAAMSEANPVQRNFKVNAEQSIKLIVNYSYQHNIHTELKHNGAILSFKSVDDISNESIQDELEKLYRADYFTIKDINQIK